MNTQHCLDSFGPYYPVLGISKELNRNCVKITYSAFSASAFLSTSASFAISGICKKYFNHQNGSIQITLVTLVTVFLRNSNYAIFFIPLCTFEVLDF